MGSATPSGAVPAGRLSGAGPGAQDVPVVPEDRIEVRGLRVLGVHGALANERLSPQPFSLDLDIWLDASFAAASDALEDTADYDALVRRAARVVAGTSYHLLEALAAAVAGELLAADGRAAAVGVTVRKLRPPLPVDVESVAVRTVRRRAAPGDPPGGGPGDPPGGAPAGPASAPPAARGARGPV